MSALGRFLPFAIVSRDRPLLGENGHRNFDAKSRIYEFVSSCLGSFPNIHERLLSAISGHSLDYTVSRLFLHRVYNLIRRSQHNRF